SRETATKQNPVGGFWSGGVLCSLLGTILRSRSELMRKASVCHLKVSPSARSPTLVRKKAPPTKRGPRLVVMQRTSSHLRTSPNRICGIGSMVRSVAHERPPASKKMPGRIWQRPGSDPASLKEIRWSEPEKDEGVAVRTRLRPG